MLEKTIKLSILLLCFCFHASAYNINLTHFTVKDGLQNSTVYYIMQDKKGFIWFCTETGVNRFDGRTFEAFTINNGLADNEIFKCFEDSKGRIWFLSYNGKLSYFYKGKIYNNKNTSWLSYNSSGAFLLDIIEDRDQTIWITNSVGNVLKIAGNKIELIASYPATERQHNRYYLSANLFLENDTAKKFSEQYLTNNDSIYVFNLVNKKFHFIGFKDQLFQQAHPWGNYDLDRNSKIFLVEYALVKYHANSLSFFDLSELGITTKLMCFLMDGGSCWLGTSGDGTIRTNITSSNKNLLHILPGKTITCILKDNENNTWFTTHGDGVYVMKNNAGYTTTLPAKTIYSSDVIHSKAGNCLLAGDDNGNVYLSNDSGVTNQFRVSGSKFNRIRDIIPINDTSIYIGTDDELLYKYNYITRQLITLEKQGVYKNYFISANHTLYTCSNESVFKITDNSTMTLYNAKNLGKYTAIALTSDSTLYLGTTATLYKTSLPNTGQVKIILSDSQLLTGVNDLRIINDALWVTTHGNGVFILKRDTIFKHISSQNSNLPSDVCQKIYDDGKSVWLCTNNGIAILDRNNGNFRGNISSFIALSSNDVKNITSDGEYMYAATADGINIFRSVNIFDTTAPSKIYFTNYKKDSNITLDPPDTISFNYFRGFIDIGFTAISFNAPSDIQYEYKFENDEQWHSTKSTIISLSNLPPGTHILLCRAKKYNSNWSPPAFLTIIVNPLWYQANWFYICILLVTILFTYLIIKQRIKTIHQRAQARNEFQNKIRDLENKSLAYQMNPHFIFNSLNTIQQFMLIENQEQGLNYLNDFSVLMRKMLENSRKPYITLNEEIDFLTRYLQLEKTRFNDKFEYTINIDKALLDQEIKIPPVLFQPLLENAIKHGIASTSKGFVSLSIRKENKFLIGIVEDNGTGIFSTTLNNKKGSTALKVLEERLKLISTNTGQTGSINIIDKSQLNPPGHGTIVEVVTPILE